MQGSSRHTARLGAAILAFLPAAGAAVLAGCATTPADRGLRTGQESLGPWWMRATALTRDGHLDLTGKSWWPQAKNLPLGQQFLVAADGAPPRAMLVRRERAPTRSGKTVEAIVWVIDDGLDGSAPAGGDRVNDCYVADYGADGLADRMVDWIDDDADGLPDEMDIRYFRDGTLDTAWFGQDRDGDGHMWSLAGYEYGGPSFFEADPHGNNMIWMNKFDPTRGAWGPISECPFAFYDTDGDGYSEVVVRFSAAPLGYDRNADPDYANTRYAEPWHAGMEHMGLVNVRYSFDLDAGSGPAEPLHYDAGFNLVGAVPYAFRGFHHYHPHRRPPQVTVVAPHERVRAIADAYPATESALSWHEHADDTIRIGHGPRADDDRRWEGVFWTWERRFMENTGGPTQKWNVRREWRGTPSGSRELYFSGVDGRLHLLGAQEGWIQIGHFAGLGRLGEIRMFDTDGNGIFDRWEVTLGDDPQPARIAAVRDEKAVRLGPFDANRTAKFYLEEALPRAAATRERLMAAMTKVRPFPIDGRLERAMAQGPVGHRQYARDVACELQYHDLCRRCRQLAQRALDRSRPDDLRTLPEPRRTTTPNSHAAWRALGLLARLDAAYGQNDVEEAVALLADLADAMAPLTPADTAPAAAK